MKLSAIKRIVEERKMDMEIIVNNKVSKKAWGGPQQNFIWGVPAPRSNLVPFYIPFMTEKVNPFCITLIDKWYPFQIISLEHCIPFNPLSPNSDRHQFSPNNIHMLPREMVMRVNKMITKEKML